MMADTDKEEYFFQFMKWVDDVKLWVSKFQHQLKTSLVSGDILPILAILLGPLLAHSEFNIIYSLCVGMQ
jgi:hypothetical protein